MGSRDRRIIIHRQKLVRPYLKNKPGMVAHAYNPTYSRDKGRPPAKKQKTISENQKLKS
jgi:hypothetical protein